MQILFPSLLILATCWNIVSAFPSILTCLLTASIPAGEYDLYEHYFKALNQNYLSFLTSLKTFSDLHFGFTELVENTQTIRKCILKDVMELLQLVSDELVGNACKLTEYYLLTDVLETCCTRTALRRSRFDRALKLDSPKPIYAAIQGEIKAIKDLKMIASKTGATMFTLLRQKCQLIEQAMVHISRKMPKILDASKLQEYQKDIFNLSDKLFETENEKIYDYKLLMLEIWNASPKLQSHHHSGYIREYLPSFNSSGSWLTTTTIDQLYILPPPKHNSLVVSQMQTFQEKSARTLSTIYGSIQESHSTVHPFANICHKSGFGLPPDITSISRALPRMTFEERQAWDLEFKTLSVVLHHAFIHKYRAFTSSAFTSKPVLVESMIDLLRPTGLHVSALSFRFKCTGSVLNRMLCQSAIAMFNDAERNYALRLGHGLQYEYEVENDDDKSTTFTVFSL